MDTIICQSQENNVCVQYVQDRDEWEAKGPYVHPLLLYLTPVGLLELFQAHTWWRQEMHRGTSHHSMTEDTHNVFPLMFPVLQYETGNWKWKHLHLKKKKLSWSHKQDMDQAELKKKKKILNHKELFKNVLNIQWKNVFNVHFLQSGVLWDETLR